MTLELTDIVIGGTAFSILSSDYQVKGKSLGAKRPEDQRPERDSPRIPSATGRVFAGTEVTQGRFVRDQLQGILESPREKLWGQAGIVCGR